MDWKTIEIIGKAYTLGEAYEIYQKATSKSIKMKKYWKKVRRIVRKQNVTIAEARVIYNSKK